MGKNKLVMAIQHHARKRFGQNFLSDSDIIHRIIKSINPKPGQRLIEIGPGLGALTCPILKLVKEMDVIELDRDIVPKLQLNCGLDAVQNNQLRIHNIDILKFNFAELNYDAPLRIIGNLPYNISTPIIFHLVEFSDIIQDMYFMLQKEVVMRLAAKPDTSNYSRLSVMAQYYFHITPLFLVPPESFQPMPKVESGIVRLVPHKEKPIKIDNEKAFSKFITQAFSQRRKTLRNVLKDICSAQQLESIDINPSARAQSLTLQQFASIYTLISS